jgi:energy-coupling factor transporter ATP-binding protein EcfA2
VAGDELIGMLRRINEEWGVAVLLGEHRLERCLAAADRVVAMDEGAIAFDGSPAGFLAWALERRPELATPAATLFGKVGLRPPPSVREARRTLLARGVDLGTGTAAAEPSPEQGPGRREPVALRLRDAWLELGVGEGRTDALRGLDLAVGPGERVALMGRNGAGKSTLLRVAAGLLEPDRGRVEAPRGVALLPQRPGDMFARERVGDELPGEEGRAALALVGLDGLEDSDPRDLSGGQRQRLALAIALAGRGGGSGEPPGAVLLDEPTRGMDRARKRDLARLAEEMSERGAAVVIATHDVEFAAQFAERMVLMGRGEVVADGPAQALLAGGWYFSTEVARVLSGRAVSAEDGARVLGAELRRVPEPASPPRDRGAR